MRDELPILEDELREARIKAEHWANRHRWEAEVERLELAIEQDRLRLADVDRRRGEVTR
jgi:hypothetical protein